jgi:dTDP-4-dehydrorhamnose 3,5-epimerase
MIVRAETTNIHLCREIVPDVFYDYRGEYVETWNEEEYLPLINPGATGAASDRFLQDDISVSRKDTLRGLHGDSITWKLVQCLHGTLLLTVLDLRKDSPSFLRHQQWTLNDRNRRQVLVPPGCVNGHLCLTDACIFSYKQTSFYRQQKQVTVRYDSFGIQWPVAHPILSQRDREGRYYGTSNDYQPG